MKNTILLYFISLHILLSCKAQQQTTAPSAVNTSTGKTAPATATVTWGKKFIDIGPVKKGDKKELFFEFTNTSGQDLQIDIVDACHCTEVEFPRGIIAPDTKKRLDVIFDSTEKDTSETIDIRVIFKQNDAKGNPLIETVQYKFDIVK